MTDKHFSYVYSGNPIKYKEYLLLDIENNYFKNPSTRIIEIILEREYKDLYCNTNSYYYKSQIDPKQFQTLKDYT